MKRALSILSIYAAAVTSVMQLAKIITRFETLQATNPDISFNRDFYISTFGVTGIALAFLMPAIGSRFKNQKIFLIGIIIGALSAACLALPIGPGVLCVVRCLEGLAHVLIITSGPGLIKTIAPPRFLPISMYLWGTFFAVGFLAESYLGDILTHAATPIHFIISYAFTYIICLTLFIPTYTKCNDIEETKKPTKGFHQTHTSIRVFGLSFAFIIYAILYIGWISYPELISKHTNQTIANSFSIAAFFGNIVGLLFGAIFRKYLSPSICGAGVFLVLAYCLLSVPLDTASFLFILLGTLPIFIYGSFPNVLHTQAEFVFASSCLLFSGNLGTFFAPQFFGSLIGQHDTLLATTITLITALLAAAAMLAISRPRQSSIKPGIQYPGTQ